MRRTRPALITPPCSVLWMRSWRPFSVVGRPRVMRSGRMPSLTHQTDKALTPYTAENGVPLSVRIVSGNPNSTNASSNTLRHASSSA